jgi:hypothetical protein
MHRRRWHAQKEKPAAPLALEEGGLDPDMAAMMGFAGFAGK